MVLENIFVVYLFFGPFILKKKITKKSIGMLQSLQRTKERGRLNLDIGSCRKIKRYRGEILLGLENKRTSPINRTHN